MSKNLTRKGLAFGALVALGSTVIAGAPAQAAGEINLVATAGTSYNTYAGASFTLEASFAPGYSPADASQLKYVVTTDGSAVQVDEDKDSAADAVTGLTAASLNSSNSVVVASERTLPTQRSFLAVKMAAATDTESVTVTAFADANNNGALDSGEWNTVRTLGFKKLADVTPVVTLTAPTVGDTSVSASVAWGDINTDMIANEVVSFTYNNGSSVTANGSLNSTSGKWEITSLNPGLAASSSVSAQAKLGSDNAGTAATAAAAAQSISGLIANVAKGNDAIATTQTTANQTNTTARVRTNGTFVASVKALDTATTPAAKSGVAATATVSVSGATLAAAATGVSEVSITVAGKKYTSLTGVTFPVTTGADGTATLEISTVGFTAAGSVTVSFAAQNVTSAVVADFEDTDYDVSSSEVGSLSRSIAEGGSVTVGYAVKDQFGVAIANGYSLLVTNDLITDVVSRVNVIGGVASATLTDTTLETGTAPTITAVLQKQSTTDLNWSNEGSDAENTIVHTVNVRSTAADFTTAPAATATVARSTDHTFSSLVVNNGGAAVTVSATGVTFTYGGVEYANTVTFFSPANGTFSIAAKSNVSGAKSITFTVGSVTKTSVLTVSGPTAGQGTKLTFTAPATIEPGKTLTVTGKLVDEYGNGVELSSSQTTADFKVTYAGPGFTTVALPTTTDANGEFKVQVLTGPTDSGNAVFTVTYDSDKTGATAAISATATVAVAAPAAPEVKTTIVGVTKAIRVRVENAKGEEVEIVVNGRTVAVATAGTNSKLWVLKSTKGKKSVKVYVDGDLVAVKTVTVK